MSTMTNSAVAKLLLILADGKPYTCAEIAVLAGMTQDKARKVLNDLLSRERVQSTPVQYQITPAGVDRAMWKPADHNALKNERRRAARGKKASAKRQEQHMQIVRTVPNSVFALGRM